MTRQTMAENVKDIAHNLGGDPKGKTVAELLDELENLVGTGSDTVTEGSISDEDMDSVFND